MGDVRVWVDATLAVWVTEEDVRSWEGFQEAVASGMSGEDMVKEVARLKVSRADEVQVRSFKAEVDEPHSVDWESIAHPAEPSGALFEDEPENFRERPPKETLSAKRAANSNPMQGAANDCIKVVKELQSLLNTLATLQNREEIAEAAGLQQLPEAIDRLYALADQYRMGGVANLQTAYAGWDPERLRREAKPFVDAEESPVEVVKDPAEEFRFENERASAAHTDDAPLDK